MLVICSLLLLVGVCPVLCPVTRQAILAGAIPVIIGSAQLMRLQFQFEGDRPPFVFAASPQEALELCHQLVWASNEDVRDGEGNTVIDELRRQVVAWYVRVYQNINNRVGFTLESFGQ